MKRSVLLSAELATILMLAQAALAADVKPLFEVGAAGDNDKIYPDTPPWREGPIQLALAGNEYGSFQLAIAPLGLGIELKGVSVSFAPLKGPNGQAIGIENLEWFRVGYVKLEKPPAWLKDKKDKYDHNREPDQLLPAKPFDVPASGVGAVWVDLRLPEGTPAGDYAGVVTVSTGGQSVSRDIRVHAHGFDIPRTSSVPVECWFTPVGNWQPFYGQFAYTPELYAKHARIIGKYRIGSFPNIYICTLVPIYREADGKFTFDWTTLDKYVKIALENGTKSFWSSGGWAGYLNSPGTPVIERATGARKTIADYMQAKWKAHGETDEAARAKGKAQFENPIYRDFLVAYVQHLKDLKINDMSWYELFDEANQHPTPERWLEMIEHHKFLRGLVPDLHLFNFGFVPTIEIEGKTAAGLVDAWAPHLCALSSDAEVPASWRYKMPVYDSIVERRAKHGEKFWFYDCTILYDKQGNYTPSFVYHKPNLELRMHGWMAWRYQADGFFIYALSYVPPANCGKKAEERWPNREWSDGGEMGCGTLIYPGPDFEVIPSMRLASVRKGLEDYEYFTLLRAEAKKLDAAKHPDLAARVEKALNVEPDIIKSVLIWTKDPNRLESKRAELAGLIREVKAAKP